MLRKKEYLVFCIPHQNWIIVVAISDFYRKIYIFLVISKLKKKISVLLRVNETWFILITHDIRIFMTLHLKEHSHSHFKQNWRYNQLHVLPSWHTLIILFRTERSNFSQNSSIALMDLEVVFVCLSWSCLSLIFSVRMLSENHSSVQYFTSCGFVFHNSYAHSTDQMLLIDD